MPLSIAYIGLGANLADRLHTLRAAVSLIERLPGTTLNRTSDLSSLYETSPHDVTDAQPPYLNAVVRITTALTPHELLTALSDIEHSLGRVRLHPGASRTIDLDLLLFDDLVINTPDLTLPHPRLHQRRFVLEPLAEIAPNLRHPMTGRSIAELLADVKVSQPNQHAHCFQSAPW